MAVRWCCALRLQPSVPSLKACTGARVKVGAQNIHWGSAGAYTGEISGDMLRELGVR